MGRGALGIQTDTSVQLRRNVRSGPIRPIYRSGVRLRPTGVCDSCEIRADLSVQSDVILPEGGPSAVRPIQWWGRTARRLDVSILDSTIVRVYGPDMDPNRRVATTNNAPRRDKLTRPRYIISIAAELSSCHPRTLRNYEEEGLLQPQRRNNLRLYSETDIQRVRIIRFLTRQQRVNLAGVRVILQLVALGKIRVYDLFDEDDVERFAEDEPELAESSAEGASPRGN